MASKKKTELSLRDLAELFEAIDNGMMLSTEIVIMLAETIAHDLTARANRLRAGRNEASVSVITRLAKVWGQPEEKKGLRERRASLMEALDVHVKIGSKAHEFVLLDDESRALMGRLLSAWKDTAPGARPQGGKSKYALLATLLAKSGDKVTPTRLRKERTKAKKKRPPA